MRILILSITILGLLANCSKEKTGNENLVRSQIMDNAYLLTQPQKDSITQLISSLEKEIGSQISIVTITSLDGQTIENFSLETFDRLGLGRPTHNDGILITVALADRTSRIEVGIGLENIIRDEVAAKLIREVVNPNFIAERYGRGLYTLVDSISRRIVDHKEMVGQEPRWK